MAKRALTEDEILAAIDREEGQAYGHLSGQLTEDRTKALDYYYGREYGNEVPDRSQIVTRDVAETIEWVMPALLKIFMSGDEVVRFDPTGPEDIQQAEQETEYLNYTVLQKNDSFQTFYTWFKDALLQKTGYVKVYWDEEQKAEFESYQGLFEDELTYLLQANPDVEIVEQEQEIDPVSGLPMFNIKLQKTVEYGCVKIIPVPPEEMLVSVHTPGVSLKDSAFTQHRTMRYTVSDVRSWGYDIDEDLATADHLITEEGVTRDEYGENTWEEEGADATMRRVVVRDTYIKLDADGDGIAELRRILTVGKQILENEPAEFVPFAALCPVPMPHRHVGLSYADLIMDLQLLKSTFLRQIIDNMYLQNNGRHAINADRVNLDDMLISRPGGVVRVKGEPAGAIFPLQHPPLGPSAFSMLEYIDTLKENRTGVTKYNQGLDANSLNKTASGISQIMGAAQERIQTVARVFAETGVKECFLMAHALTLKHQRKPQIIRLRNEFVPVDPRQWKTRTDLSIVVGLGTGNKDQQLMHLQTILMAQKEAYPLGMATEKNIYNALAKLTQNAGFKNPEEFFTDVTTNPPPPKSPPQPTPDAQLKAKVDMEKAKMQIQADMQKQQVDTQQNALSQQLEMEKLKMEAALKEREMVLNMELEREKLQAQHQLALQKAQMDAETKMNVANLSRKPVPPADLPDYTPAFDEVRMAIAELLETARSPKSIERGPDGRIARVGGREVVRGPDGRAMGIQ